MRGYATIEELDHGKGGIPETGRINKNRTALFWWNEDNDYPLKDWLEESVRALKAGEIDTIIIDVKKRTW